MNTLVPFDVRMLALCFVLLMQACSTLPERAPATVDGVSSAVARQSPELNSLVQGDTAQFYTGLLAPLGEVIIGRQYHAASGRVCKRILDINGAELLAVACQQQNEQWYVRPSLNQSSSQGDNTRKGVRAVKRTLVPAQSVVEPSSIPIANDGTTSGYRLKPDETLWSFAQRTTGSALNWQAIARFNGIEDASLVEQGTALGIPADLQRAGR